MTSTVQLSGKTNDGRIFVVGGTSFDDFYANLITAVGGDQARADSIIADVIKTIEPLSSDAGFSQAQHNVEQSFGQGNVAPINSAPSYQGGPPPQVRQSGGTPPGQQAPFCPNHNAPARWVAPGVAKGTGKPYSGFWACAVSERGDNSCKIAR